MQKYIKETALQEKSKESEAKIDKFLEKLNITRTQLITLAKNSE